MMDFYSVADHIWQNLANFRNFSPFYVQALLDTFDRMNLFFSSFSSFGQF